MSPTWTSLQWTLTIVVYALPIRSMSSTLSHFETVINILWSSTGYCIKLPFFSRFCISPKNFFPFFGCVGASDALLDACDMNIKWAFLYILYSLRVSRSEMSSFELNWIETLFFRENKLHNYYSKWIELKKRWNVIRHFRNPKCQNEGKVRDRVKEIRCMYGKQSIN